MSQSRIDFLLNVIAPHGDHPRSSAARSRGENFGLHLREREADRLAEPRTRAAAPLESLNRDPIRERNRAAERDRNRFTSSSSPDLEPKSPPSSPETAAVSGDAQDAEPDDPDSAAAASLANPSAAASASQTAGSGKSESGAHAGHLPSQPDLGESDAAPPSAGSTTGAAGVASAEVLPNEATSPAETASTSVIPTSGELTNQSRSAANGTFPSQELATQDDSSGSPSAGTGDASLPIGNRDASASKGVAHLPKGEPAGTVPHSGSTAGENPNLAGPNVPSIASHAVTSSTRSEGKPRAEDAGEPSSSQFFEANTNPSISSEGRLATLHAMPADVSKAPVVTASLTAINILSEKASNRHAGEEQRTGTLLQALNRVQPSAMSGPGNLAGESNEAPLVDPARFVERVSKAFQSALERDGKLTLRLSPAELGSMRLELTVKDGIMAAVVETESDTARQVLLDHLPALRDRLADQNIRIEQFDVDVRRDGPGSDTHAGSHSEHRHDNDHPPHRPQAREAPGPRSTTRPIPALTPSIGEAELDLVI